jgi:hypothetical protein
MGLLLGIRESKHGDHMYHFLSDEELREKFKTANMNDNAKAIFHHFLDRVAERDDNPDRAGFLISLGELYAVASVVSNWTHPRARETDNGNESTDRPDEPAADHAVRGEGETDAAGDSGVGGQEGEDPPATTD